MSISASRLLIISAFFLLSEGSFSLMYMESSQLSSIVKLAMKPNLGSYIRAKFDSFAKVGLEPAVQIGRTLYDISLIPGRLSTI